MTVETHAAGNMEHAIERLEKSGEDEYGMTLQEVLDSSEPWQGGSQIACTIATLALVLCVSCGDGSANPDFRSFRLSSSGGPCIPEDDCAASIELSMDGTLRVDRWGELPVVVHEATVSAEDLATAISVLTDPELVALLGGPTLPCSLVTDFVESMEVVLADGARRNNVTTCEDPPIEAALATVRQLSETYLPEE